MSLHRTITFSPSLMASSDKSNVASFIGTPLPSGVVTLLVPRHSVSAGSKFSEIELNQMFWPRSSVPAGAIREEQEIPATICASSDLPRNAPLLLKSFVDCRELQAN